MNEEDTMYSLRHKRKAFVILIVVGAFFYYMLWPSSRNKRIARQKERHPASYFRQQVLTNDTLFNLIIDLDFVHENSKEALKSYLRPQQHPQKAISFQPNLLQVVNDFNINEDVIVYLHIQKAGGTVFNMHLMKDLVLEKPCECEKSMLTNPCHCKNKHGNIWLFSWFSVGWPCELHADWTMLHECVDEALNEIEGKKRVRRYFYVTLLRDPVARYLSEWKHHRTGQHWKDGKLKCNGERVTFFDVRPCFAEKTWEGVTLDDFMECRDNLATNRQTRMLADLRESQCYHRDKLRYEPRVKMQLKSALENVGSMAFFGLTDQQEHTKELFEKAFGLQFTNGFKTLEDNDGDELVSDDEFIEMIKYIELDVQLYLYANKLFSARVKSLGG